jgi:CRISPR-associated protein Cmr4
VKGAMRVWSGEHHEESLTKTLFGEEIGGGSDDGASTKAGLLLWSDAKLLLLPVRSTTSSYRLVTCQDLINRLRRDRRRAGLPAKPPVADPVKAGEALGQGPGEWIGLEEREFRLKGPLKEDIVGEALPLVEGSYAKEDLDRRILQLNNDDFAWFARYALPVMARNKLTADKVVDGGALWNEEALAPDTVLYLHLSERKAGFASKIAETLRADQARYVQMGGNETIGQGWLRMNVVGGA